MSRNGTLDYARLIAAFGIVFFHAHAPGAAIGYAALPFFLILLVVMSVPAASRMPFGPFAGGRAQRLLTPWLIWSGIYGALKLTEIVATGASFASEFAPYMILTGPALHLWFLPFALVVCVVAYPAVRRASWPLSVALSATGMWRGAYDFPEHNQMQECAQKYTTSPSRPKFVNFRYTRRALAVFLQLSMSALAIPRHENQQARRSKSSC